LELSSRQKKKKWGWQHRTFCPCEWPKLDISDGSGGCDSLQTTNIIRGNLKNATVHMN
jgi:hypothetical protein